MTTLSAPEEIPKTHTADVDGNELRKIRICNIVHANTGKSLSPRVSVRSVKQIYSNSRNYTGESRSERAEISEAAIDEAIEDGLLFWYNGTLAVGTEARLNSIVEAEQETDDPDADLIAAVNQFKETHQ